MHPTTHFYISWIAAHSLNLEKRERILITYSGLIADIDGLGVIADLITWKSSNPTHLYHKYHHLLSHNFLTALVVALICYYLTKKNKIIVFLLSFMIFHLHLFCDLIGSKGPDGFQWPIYYFWPFNKIGWTVNWQWELFSWQNTSLTYITLIIVILVTKYKRCSPFEIISNKLDLAFVNIVKKIFK